MAVKLLVFLATFVLFSVTPLKAQNGDDRLEETSLSTNRLQTESMRLTFKSGSTLRGLLEQANLRDGEVDAIIVELNKYTLPNKYRVDQYFDLEIIPEEGNRRLQRLTFSKTLLETVVIERDGDILTSSLYEAPTLTERRLLVVPVEGSVWQVTGINGVPVSVRAKTLNILSYGLDLQRELQPHDRLEIIYDATVTEEGDVVAGGAIHYVALIQKNRAKRYFRFEEPGHGIEYYDEQGLLTVDRAKVLDKKYFPAFQQMVAMIDDVLPGDVDQAYLAKLEGFDEFVKASLAQLEMFEDGGDAHNRGDYSTAFNIWLSLAEQENVSAQFNIGLMYKQGQGILKNFSEAAYWFQMAAKQGDPQAQLELASLYQMGRGILENPTYAYMWHAIGKANGGNSPLNMSSYVSKEERAQALRLAKKCMESNYQDCD